MLTLKKIMAKLKYYWLNDFDFRVMILSNIDLNIGERVIYFLARERESSAEALCQQKYPDLENINLWAFLVGFFFPARDIGDYGNYAMKFRSLGVELGENGEIWRIWQKFDDRSFIDSRESELLRLKFNRAADPKMLAALRNILENEGS